MTLTVAPGGAWRSAQPRAPGPSSLTDTGSDRPTRTQSSGHRYHPGLFHRSQGNTEDEISALIERSRITTIAGNVS